MKMALGAISKLTEQHIEYCALYLVEQLKKILVFIKMVQLTEE